MKIKLKRQEFLKSWQIAEKVAATKTTKDALSGIFITAAEDGKTTLEATDLKTSVRCEAEGVEIIEPGFAILPSVILGSMFKKADSDELDLEVNSERGYLKAGNSKTRFPIISVEEFPKIPESSGAEFIFDIQASDFAKIISEGGSSASQPEDFPKYMGTCLLRTEKGYVKIASTDGKRFSLSQIPGSNIAKEEDYLLPAAPFKDFSKALMSAYSDKNVKVLSDASTVWFNLESVEFSIRIIDASFPIYERILNKVIETSMRIKPNDLLPVLERIDIIARTTTAHIMSMFLYPDKHELKITARAPEKGTASETIPAQIDGKFMQIGFNVNYFQDGLKVLGPGEVFIEFSDEEGQTRMKRMKGDEVDEDFLYMLMPARLGPQDRIAEREINELDGIDSEDYDETLQETSEAPADENVNQDENHEGEGNNENQNQENNQNPENQNF